MSFDTHGAARDNAIARVAHEANREYCATRGDYSQVPWVDAPEWQRESARKGVQFLRETPDAPPSASHDSWLRVKRADGWIYGPVKCPDEKVHPCMVEYDELPEEQQRKDALFTAVVRALL